MRDLYDDVSDLVRYRLRPPPILEDGRDAPDVPHPSILRTCPTCGALPGMLCATVGGATANGGRVPTGGTHGLEREPHTSRIIGARAAFWGNG